MKKSFTLLALMAMFVVNTVFAQEKPILTIGCLSDLHSQQTLISGKVDEVRLRGTVTNTLEAMKAEEDLDLIVLGGDYLSDVTIPLENYIRMRELLVEATRAAFPEGGKTPVIYVNGNHEYEVANFDYLPKGYNAGDYYSIPMKTDIGELPEGDAFYEIADNGSAGTTRLLAAYHYVVKGFDFVVLNTGKRLFASAWDYYYSMESVEWCEEKLAQICAEDPTKTVFFLIHIPFSDSNSLSAANKGISGASADYLKEVLAKYPNLIMLYGHDHGKDSAYIRSKTEQRVTVYNSYGEKWVDPTAEGEASPTAFYVKNAASGKYLNFDPSANLTTTSAAAVATIEPSSLVDGTYSISYPDGNGGLRYTQSGTAGRFSGNAALSANSSLYVYKVEDAKAQSGIATRVETIEDGASYVFVALSSKGGYWMLTNESFGSGADLRLNGVKVSDEVPGDQVNFTQSSTISPVWTIEQVEVSEEEENGMVYYIQNYNTGKFLGFNEVNLAPVNKQSSDVTITASTVTEGAFTFSLTKAPTSNPYLYCGSNGRFSGNSSATNVSSQILAFEVENPDAETLTAKQVTEITVGKTYLLVGIKSGKYYALTDALHKEGNATDQRMIGAEVTIADGVITFTPGESSVLWTINEKIVEPATKSFFSAFMGSMRYYSNTIDGSVGPSNSRIVQAMIVYVYEDRVELTMKNYGESGKFGSITINKDLEPYIAYRKVTHSAEAVTAAPSFSAEAGKDAIILGDTAKIAVVAPEWHNVYYTLDGTEPTESSAKVQDGVIEWKPEADGDYTIKIAAQEGVRLLSESVSCVYRVVKDGSGVEAVEAKAEVIASESGVTVRGYAGLVKIHNVVGQQSKVVSVSDTQDIVLDKGIYIVVLGDKAFKVIVK